ncbi:hypothetical protein D3C75_569300 [compost metagenome]
MHIHIGRTESGLPVKISGAANLTFHNIAREASQRKGIDVVGIIDCHSPGVQAEIDSRLAVPGNEECPAQLPAHLREYPRAAAGGGVQGRHPDSRPYFYALQKCVRQRGAADVRASGCGTALGGGIGLKRRHRDGLLPSRAGRNDLSDGFGCPFPLQDRPGIQPDQDGQTHVHRICAGSAE